MNKTYYNQKAKPGVKRYYRLLDMDPTAKLETVINKPEKTAGHYG